MASSIALPLLPLDEIPGWLERFETEGESATMLAFLDWVRSELAPRGEESTKSGIRNPKTETATGPEGKPDTPEP